MPKKSPAPKTTKVRQGGTQGLPFRWNGIAIGRAELACLNADLKRSEAKRLARKRAEKEGTR